MLSIILRFKQQGVVSAIWNRILRWRGKDFTFYFPNFGGHKLFVKTLFSFLCPCPCFLPRPEHPEACPLLGGIGSSAAAGIWETLETPPCPGAGSPGGVPMPQSSLYWDSNLGHLLRPLQLPPLSLVQLPTIPGRPFGGFKCNIGSQERSPGFSLTKGPAIEGVSSQRGYFVR